MRIEDLAYLKTPDSVRAALINTTGSAPSIDVIRRKLSVINARGTYYRPVGEPTASDAKAYTPQGMIDLEDVARRELRKQAERDDLATWASAIPDKEEPRPKIVRKHRKPNHTATDYSRKLIDYVCQEMSVSTREWNRGRRAKRATAASSLVARILKERSKSYSYKKIAHCIDRHDHSTVMYLMDQFDVLAKQFPEMMEIYERLRRES